MLEVQAIRSRARLGAVVMAAGAVLLILAACNPSPTVASVRDDEVQITANGANLPQAQAKAQEACAPKNLTAKLTGFRCVDRYCMQGTYTFACRPPA
jgi:hypothetical protein